MNQRRRLQLNKHTIRTLAMSGQQGPDKPHPAPSDDSCMSKFATCTTPTCPKPDRDDVALY